MFLNKKFCLIIISVLFCLFLFGSCSSVYAATTGNSENVFNNVYSITEYTTIQNLLDDSGLAPSIDVVNNFLSDKTYKNKYIISYCNSANCEEGANARSIDLIAFNDDVDVDFIQNDRQLTIKFYGDSSAQVYFYDYSQIWSNSYTASLSYIDYKKEYNSFRTVVPVSYLNSVDDRLGSLLVDNIFVKLNYYVLPLITISLLSLVSIILLFWGFPKLLKFFKNLVS